MRESIILDPREADSVVDALFEGETSLKVLDVHSSFLLALAVRSTSPTCSYLKSQSVTLD